MKIWRGDADRGRLRTVGLVGLSFACALSACSSSDRGDHDNAIAGSSGALPGAAGRTGTAGASGASLGGGGAGAASGSGGGASGALGTGVAGAGPVCMPMSTGFVSGNPLYANYDATSGGIPPDANLFVASYTLNQPLVPGQPYAVSGLISGNSPMIEVWGSSSKCGPGLQKLAEQQTIAGHSYCFELQPDAEYSDLLIVFRGPSVSGSGYSDLRFCGGGSCP